MAELVVERCPETGICSIVKTGGKKIDLMPDEAEELKQVRSQPAKLRELLADIDPTFASSLSDEDVSRIGVFLKT